MGERTKNGYHSNRLPYYKRNSYFTKGIILTSYKNATNMNTNPIYLKELTLTAAELAPPITSSRDEETGLPPIGMTPDKIIDTILRKVYVEMAKSNAGKVFNSAFKEIFSWMKKTELVAFELL